MTVLERLVLTYLKSPTPAWIHSSSPTEKTSALVIVLRWPCTLWCSMWRLRTDMDASCS
ncbi:hypothetical protein NP493_3045g00002 [Ridgeia piscesae]|uniref:Uncharacterized protein n=1 Tax=Ridgeia piscesae TaxID=27915 RepID=A0AAD9J9U6_RIDPI|nr:hypothetical protein NP493_6314g00001 [Ridgeia piscesae]KAK2149164.1 hypothetical protein NP493_3045g00002 [Ridgeia piscesae]